MVAFNQEDFLKATIGDPQYLQALQGGRSSAARRWPATPAWPDVLNANAAKAKQLLTEAGYDGTPIVLMQSTDLPVLTNLAPVAKALMEQRRLQGRHG